MDIRKKEDGSLILSFSLECSQSERDEPQQKRISIVFDRKTTKNELLKALQEGGMELKEGIQYYTRNMLIELYGYNSKNILQQIDLNNQCRKIGI